jgi:hypothetical protein
MLPPHLAGGVSRVTPNGLRVFPEFFSPDENWKRIARFLQYDVARRFLKSMTGIAPYKTRLLVWASHSTIVARRRCALRFPELEKKNDA